MRAAVIINPIAGVRIPGDTPERRVALAQRILTRHDIDGAVMVTERAGHARELAGQAVAEGCELVVAWGGDGTINEVAAVLIHSRTALGIVPAGSGNGLAHGLGLPVRPAAALARALAGSARKIDVGEFGGRRFFNVAGIGFDAAVAARFNRQGHARGPLAYVRSIAPRFLSYEAVPCIIEADGESSAQSVLMVTIANCREFGSHAVIAPHARPDDGLLDLVVIPDRSPVDRLSLVPHVFAGTIDRAAGVLMRRATRVRIASDRPLPFHVDGEPHDGAQVVEAHILPGALIVRC
jgi:YegS/Rv2252/BmrU family lipid kinase